MPRFDRRLDDGAGAGAQADLLGQLAQLGDFGRHVEGPIVDRGHPAAGGRSPGRPGQVLLRRIRRRPCKRPSSEVSRARPKPTRHAGQGLQLQRDVFEDVPRIGAVAQPLEEPAPLADAAAVLDHRGQPGHQPLVEAGQDVGGRIFQLLQIDPGFEHGEIGPDVRTTQGQDLTKFHNCTSLLN